MTSFGDSVEKSESSKKQCKMIQLLWKQLQLLKSLTQSYHMSQQFHSQEKLKPRFTSKLVQIFTATIFIVYKKWK